MTTYKGNARLVTFTMELTPLGDVAYTIDGVPTRLFEDAMDEWKKDYPNTKRIKSLMEYVNQELNELCNRLEDTPL